MFPLQDLAWSISYYVRFFYTYIPFYGILGALAFLNFIRYLSFAGSPCASKSTDSDVKPVPTYRGGRVGTAGLLCVASLPYPETELHCLLGFWRVTGSCGSLR